LLLGENYYTQGKTKLSRKSENAVADDRVLTFLYNADLRHVESSVQCHRKYENGGIKVDLGYRKFATEQGSAEGEVKFCQYMTL